MAQAKKPAGREVIYLDIDDDITTIIDKVEEAKQKVVAVVLPKRFTTLQSIVNMRLLKRSADTADKNIVLVTGESALLPLAGAAGLHVAKNLQSQPEIPSSPIDTPVPKPAVPEDPDAEVDAEAAKLDYHRSIGELASSGTVDEPETIPLEDAEDADKPAVKGPKTPKSKKLKVPNFDRFRLILLLGAVGLVALVVFLIMALFVLPKATITLKTEAEPINTSFELTTSDKADKLDMAEGIIPATLKKSDITKSQKVQATGEKNNGKKATGSVTMTAQDCVPFGGTPGDVPAGTGISNSGRFYITQARAQFSFDHADGNCIYYSSGSIPIVAETGGSNYNVSSATFSVTNRSEVSGSGSASGGTDVIVKVLSQGDVDAVKDKISDQDKTEFVEKFKQEIDEAGLYLIEDSLKESKISVTANPAVGQPADSADVTVKISYSALALSKDDLQTAVTEELNKMLDKQRQRIGTEDVLKATQVSIQSQKSSTVATLTITADTAAVPIIDEQAIKTQVGGQKTAAIKKLLGDYPGVREVEVDLSPFWVSKAPKKTTKITIIQDQVKTEESGSPGDSRP